MTSKTLCRPANLALVVVFVISIGPARQDGHVLADQQAASASEEPIDRQQVATRSESTADRVTLPNQYDPLKISSDKIETLKLSVTDDARSREIPLLVYLPATQKACPVILHSHGLGGSRQTSAFLGKHWAARGYVAVFLQHPGSDKSIWKDIAVRRRMSALRRAASAENLELRIHDVPAVIDQLIVWNDDPQHALFHRMNLQHLGMSGHSFGAITTQHVGGQSVVGSESSADVRIKAAIAMSPSSPRFGDVEKAFASVTIPWLCLTGTRDVSRIGAIDVESRLAVYAALPPADKYELVLNEAQHSIFTERILPGESRQRNPQHLPAILAISTAFWDAYLQENSTAKSWLQSDQARTVLAIEDRWQHK